MSRRKIAKHLSLRLVLVCCIALPTTVLAGDKLYPLEGTVTVLGTSRETTGGDMRRTYTVKNPTRVFVLECRYLMNGIHIHTPSECGGKKEIAIGDTLHFRIEKHHAYLLRDNGKEERLVVLSEGVNEESAQVAKP